MPGSSSGPWGEKERKKSSFSLHRSLTKEDSMCTRTSSTTLSVLADLAKIGSSGKREFEKWAHENARDVSPEYGKGIVDATDQWINHFINPMFDQIKKAVETELLIIKLSNMLEEK